MTEGVLKQWLLKYRTGDAAATGSGSMKSALELHEAHGAELKALPPEQKTRYRLCKYLRERDPPGGSFKNAGKEKGIEIPKGTALLIEQTAIYNDAVQVYTLDLYRRAALRVRL